VVTVRAVSPAEHKALGQLTVEAYGAVEPTVLDDGYEAELRDVAHRAAVAEVLVAVDGTGRLLGGVTYVPGPDSSLAEHDVADAASIRMLAVDPGGEGRGVGRALSVACVERAVVTGRRAVVLHSTPAMRRAHRLYESLGFQRSPGLDWPVSPSLTLLGYRLDLHTGASPPPAL
jgi:ribosomal protein S18 acetylase RimI-like enzyme